MPSRARGFESHLLRQIYREPHGFCHAAFFFCLLLLVGCLVLFILFVLLFFVLLLLLEGLFVVVDVVLGGDLLAELGDEVVGDGFGVFEADAAFSDVGFGVGLVGVFLFEPGEDGLSTLN